jgi:putative transcriptional regulator
MRNNIRVLRAERKWTQEHLAKLSGLSRVTINGIEKGSVNPSGETMLKLSEVFERPIQDIFFDFGVVYKQQ